MIIFYSLYNSHYYSNFYSPLDQIKYIFQSFDISQLVNNLLTLTNWGNYFIIIFLIVFILNILRNNNNNKITSNNWSLNKESIYTIINNLVKNQISIIKGQIYFSFIYSLFIFILINNLLGMVPYSFASTSHFILTFSLSFTIVLGATILGFQTHGLKFFSLFVAAGCLLALLSLVYIETFSLKHYSLFTLLIQGNISSLTSLFGLIISLMWILIEMVYNCEICLSNIVTELLFLGEGEENLIIYSMAVVPIISYINADTQKESVLNDNKAKVGVYCWTHIESGKNT
jgi:ATP synthase subunit 6